MEQKDGRYVVYLDTGGTFSDCVIIKEDGSFVTGKALTTQDDLEICFFNAIDNAARHLGKDLKGVLKNCDLLGFGTTAGTNALITLQGPKLGLIITTGFEDTTIMMRGVGRWAGIHPFISMHVPATDKPEPLIPRYLIKGVTERIDTVGNVVVPLYEQEVREAVRELLDEGVEGIAVCLLCSYVNDVHEKRVAEIIGEMSPAMPVSKSHIVSPLIRDYARTNSTIADLFVGSAVRDLFEKIKQKLANQGYTRPLLVMQAAGGLSRSEVVSPITTLHSGPVGGLTGVEFFMDVYGFKNAVGTDVGGTSFDVSLVPEEGAKFLREPVVARYNLQNPMREILTFGAGGGTIAYIDKLSGALRVGPQSAGSSPGPVCYDKGGVEPTVTDADVIMGRIDPDYFLGGTITLNKEKAEKAMKEKIADPLGMTVLEAAEAVCTIIDSYMRDALHTNFATRGLNVVDYACFAFGGAGAVHCAGYTKDMGFQKVIAAPFSATFSAFGASTANVLHRYESSPYSVFPYMEFSKTDRRFTLESLEGLSKEDLERFNRMYKDLEKRCYEDMAAEGFDRKDVQVVYPVQMRYGGQLDEVEFVSPVNQITTVDDFKSILTAFEKEYIKLYSEGALYPEGGVEIMGIALQGSAVVQTPAVPEKPLASEDPGPAKKGEREVYFEGRMVNTKIYDMNKLQAGNKIDGPAIIEGIDTNLVIPMNHKVFIDKYLNMVMETSDALEETKERQKETGAQLDPVKYELFYSRLQEALFDAKEAIRMLSASEIVREGGESMECVCLPDGESVLVSSGLLAHVASVTHNIRHMIDEKYDEDIGIYKGDQFICNDCHIGGMHIPDMMLISPLFYDNRLIGWLGNGTHIPEVGAIEPGGIPASATEFWHEGICLPGVKIVERGKVRRDVMNMMRRAVRDPRGIDIDTRAKIAGNERARKNILEIIDEFGIDFYEAATRQLFLDAESQARKKIMGLAKGTFRARCYTDCVSANIQKLRMVELTFDITEDGAINITAPVVSPQGMGYNNCAFPALEGLIFCTLLWQIFYDARWNSGCLKALKFDIPKGSMISADESAAVAYAPIGIGMQVMSCVNDIISRSSFISGGFGDIMAPCSFLNAILAGGLDRYGRNCAAALTSAMMTGGGARYQKDGHDTSVTEWNPWTDFGDAEASEIKVPVFHLGRRHIPDSGGPGKYRGGSAGETTVSIHASPFAVVGHMAAGGYVTGVQGIYGGYPPPKTSLFIARDTDYLERAKKREPIPHGVKELLDIYGDKVQELYPAYIMTPTTENDIIASQCWGGGGSGDVIERDTEAIVSDIKDKLLSFETAKDVYCVAVDPETLEVNEEETLKMREAKKKERLSQGIPGQKFISGLVDKRENRDFPKPMLDFFDELNSYSPGFREQLAFEKGFADRDIHEIDIRPVKDVLDLTPYTKVVEDEKGEKYTVCSQCGHVYCRAEENFKLYSLIYDRDPKEIQKGYLGPDKDWMIYREFYCPGCGSQIEMEGTAACCPILHNVELKF